MAHKLPDEIIDLILSYAPDFHDNLLACHMEMLTDHRFVYLGQVTKWVRVVKDD